MQTFDIKVKFKGFLTCLHVLPIAVFGFDIGFPYLAHGSIILRGCVAHIHDPDTNLEI